MAGPASNSSSCQVIPEHWADGNYRNEQQNDHYADDVPTVLAEQEIISGSVPPGE
jgi:hypothetical protein